MARGRKTGGRKPGSRNLRTKATEAAMKAAKKKIEKALGKGAFEGDAHALLMAVYKDKRIKLPVRLYAAGKAIKFEKPALASVDAKVKGPPSITRKVMMFPDERKAPGG